MQALWTQLILEMLILVIVGVNVSSQTHRNKKNHLISMNQFKLFLSSQSFQGGNILSQAS